MPVVVRWPRLALLGQAPAIPHQQKSKQWSRPAGKLISPITSPHITTITQRLLIYTFIYPIY